MGPGYGKDIISSKKGYVRPPNLILLFFCRFVVIVIGYNILLWGQDMDRIYYPQKKDMSGL
jgi:hypothetical protein